MCIYISQICNVVVSFSVNIIKIMDSPLSLFTITMGDFSMFIIDCFPKLSTMG